MASGAIQDRRNPIYTLVQINETSLSARDEHMVPSRLLPICYGQVHHRGQNSVWAFPRIVSRADLVEALAHQ